MKRWLVLGSSGAGKSRFALELSKILDLPVVHLDRHFWNPGWIETERPAWHRRVVELCSGDSWIMDGNYGGSISLRLPRAEAVVLLDFPVLQCLWGIFERSTLRLGQPRPDLADGCEEQLPDLEFIRFVMSYKWRSRPRVLRQIAATPHVKLYRLRSRRQARRFLEELREAAP